MDKFTDTQIQAWKQYEAVRRSGKFNMYSPSAIAASGLDKAAYLECLKHYSELKAAAEVAA